MKLQGIFKKLANAKGLSVELQTTDGELINKTTRFKGNKFTLSINPPNNEVYKGPINVVIVDENGGKANFKRRGKAVDLSPDQQIFDIQIDTKKSKSKFKFKPKTVSTQDSADDYGAGEDTRSSNQWRIGKIKSLKTPGVSPHLDRRDDGYRLSYTDIGMTRVDDLSSDFVLTPRGQIDGISDLTVVTSGDGVQRGYYVQRDFYTDEAEIYSAEISEDGLTLTSPSATGITDGGSIAWGVPDAVRLPDGRVRLYWVEDPPAGGKEHKEWIVSATSDDITGTRFIRDSGQRTTGGYVDFEVLKAKAGDWIAVTSSTPAARPEHPPQGLYVATSKDGLDWTIETDNLAPTNRSYLDPTGVAIGEDQWQLVMAQSSTNYWGDPQKEAYTLVQTTLSVG